MERRRNKRSQRQERYNPANVCVTKPLCMQLSRGECCGIWHGALSETQNLAADCPFNVEAGYMVPCHRLALSCRGIVQSNTLMQTHTCKHTRNRKTKNLHDPSVISWLKKKKKKLTRTIRYVNHQEWNWALQAALSETETWVSAQLTKHTQWGSLHRQLKVNFIKVGSLSSREGKVCTEGNKLESN